MATKVTTLTKVGAFPGNGTYGPYVRSVFKDADGVEWTTFKGPVASQAEALVGQTVELEGNEEINGQYTNRTLLKVSAVANGNAPVQPQGQTTATHDAGSYEQDRQLRIMRQSALDRALTAFGIIGQDPIAALEELFELSDQFIDYFVNGVEKAA